MKKAQSRETFLDLQKRLQKKLGKFKSMEYLGYYEQYGKIITLFKALSRDMALFGHAAKQGGFSHCWHVMGI